MTAIRIGLVEWYTFHYVAILPVTRNYEMQAMLGWRVTEYDWQIVALWMTWEGMR